MLGIKLVFYSLWNRRVATALTLVSIMLSVTLFVGVERVRLSARESFAGTISKTDLIVGAKGGTIQLLLYAVFRMGSATANVTYETYEEIKSDPQIAWTIPYSLGDSHRGFRVVGTTEDFYKHYQFRGDHRIEFQGGGPAKGYFDVVLGSDVAERLHYQVGDKIVLAHGVGDVLIQTHQDKPFTVVGVLKKTTTPIDRSLYITLEGMEAIHVDWGDGAPPVPGEEVTAEEVQTRKLEIKAITAFLVGAKSRLDTLGLQRKIDEYESEALMAIMPGVALSELWEGISYAEEGLRVVSGFVVLVGLIGMLVAIYNSLNERRREMAILRSVGAGPQLVFILFVVESFLLTLVGSVLGVGLLYLLLFSTQNLIENHFGVFIPIGPISSFEWIYLAFVLGFGVLLGVIPAWRAYSNTLVDGLTIRV